MMDRDRTPVASTSSLMLMDKIKEAHRKYPLCGKPRNMLLELPHAQLSYVLSLLKGEQPELPSLSVSEWRLLFFTLKDHLILPFLHRQISSLPPALRPPEEAMAELRSVTLWNRARTIGQERQLRDILKAFDEACIRSVVLKGLAFRMLYPDPVMRSSLDIDLLVRPEDMLRCHSILERLGYSCLEKRFEVSREGYGEEVFQDKANSAGKYLVELHWNLILFPEVNRHLDTSSFFSRAEKKRSGDLEISVLCPVDALIYASAHLIYHHGDSLRLNWIYDIALLCESLTSESDWVQLQQRSVEAGARLALEEALKLACCWTALRIPASFGDFSRWPAPDALELEYFARFRRRGSLATLIVKIPKSATMSEKIRLLFRLVFPSSDNMTTLYPDFRGKPLYLAYVLRWWGLLKKL